MVYHCRWQGMQRPRPIGKSLYTDRFPGGPDIPHYSRYTTERDIGDAIVDRKGLMKSLPIGKSLYTDRFPGAAVIPHDGCPVPIPDITERDVWCAMVDGKGLTRRNPHGIPYFTGTDSIPRRSRYTA